MATRDSVLQITIVEGPALTSLHHLLQQPDEPNTFDFAFIGKHTQPPCACARSVSMLCAGMMIQLFLHA